MKILNLSLLLFLMVVLSPNLDAIPPKQVELAKAFQTENEPPQLMVVKFHADWCGSCRALGPAITDLSNKFDGQPVLFTELDFTNITAKNQTLLLASALGIGGVVEEHNGTGFILVIDSKTKEVKAKLNKTQPIKEMSKIIANLL